MQHKKTYIIAEAGVNHDGCYKQAKKLIDVAVAAKVDAVKFQIFDTDNLVSKNAPKANYQKQTTSQEESQYQMLKNLELTKNELIEIYEYCQQSNIDFLATPFDDDSLNFMVNELNQRKIKVASGDLNNAPLLLNIARKSCSVIVSSGMGLLGEVERALAVLAFGYSNSIDKPTMQHFTQAYCSEEGQKYLTENVSILHCTSEYPTPYHDVNLNCIDTLKSAFNLATGLSDHTEGINVPIAAVAKGACIIEKHFTLDKSLPGPDHKASLSPAELSLMVSGIRQIEDALGSSQKFPRSSEIKNVHCARKSIVAKKEICVGDKFNQSNITVKRPGHGIEPVHYWDYLGKYSKQNYREGEIIEQ